MNQFDPKMMVMVIDMTEGVPPETLYFNYGPTKEIRTFEPDFDEGVPRYFVPRDYAARLLENAGGRTFRLFSPNKLVIRKSNGKGGISLVTLNAWKKTETGSWIEKTDLEIENEGKPSVNTSVAKLVAEAPKLEEKKAEENAPAAEPVIEAAPERKTQRRRG